MVRDYKCNTYCPTPCTGYDMDSSNRTECVRAMSNCDCRPFWKTPACWLISSLSAVVLISVLRLLIIWIMKRGNKAQAVKTRKASDVNIGVNKKSDDFGMAENFPNQSLNVGMDSTRKMSNPNQSSFTECD